jgi:hypothetical protein
MIAGLLFNGFFTYARVGIFPGVSLPLAPSEINEIRNLRINFSSFLNLIWSVIVTFEGAYLFNNGLFQRFLLNGFNRWQWGHLLLLNVTVVALLLGLLQTAFINALGQTLYGIQVISWGYIFQLAASLLFKGVFILLLIALFPSYLVLLFVIIWPNIEQLLNVRPVKKALFELPEYLPLQVLIEWQKADAVFSANGGFLLGYFVLFVVLFYTLINKKAYG